MYGLARPRLRSLQPAAVETLPVIPRDVKLPKRVYRFRAWPTTTTRPRCCAGRRGSVVALDVGGRSVEAAGEGTQRRHRGAGPRSRAGPARPEVHGARL